MGFKRLLAAVVVLVLSSSILLAGCGGSGGEKKAGGEGSGPGVIKIGVFGPLSGSSSIAGTRQKDGAQFAADQLNAKGGVLGKKIELIFEDDEGVPANTTNVMNKLLYKDNVLVTMGSPNSPCVLAVMDLIKKAQTPHVVPSGVAMAITHSGNPYVFRITATDEIYSRVLVDHAVKTLGLKKIAIINDTNDYGQGGMELVKKALKDNGLEPVAVEGYNKDSKDFTPQLMKVKNVAADGLVIWGMYTEGAQIVRQVKQLSLNVKVLASTGVTIGNFFELTGSSADGLIGVTGGFHKDKQDATVQQFVKDYEAKKGYKPDMNVATAYDAVMVVAKAIEKANALDKGKIKEALAGLKDFPGLTGKLTFNQYGDGGTEALLFEIQGSQTRLIQSK